MDFGRRKKTALAFREPSADAAPRA